MTAALLVNPYDAEETAEALHVARSMPLSERQQRHALLMKRLRAFDVRRWSSDYLAALAAAPPWRPDAPADR
jgi:trehalose 6-phosphate synthase